jgi:hypothetical protein
MTRRALTTLLILLSLSGCARGWRPTPPTPAPPPPVVDPVPTPEPEPTPLPRPTAVVAGVGASDYQSLGDPRVDLPAFADRLADLGMRHTRVWLIDAWAVGANSPVWIDDRYVPHFSTYDGYLPFRRQADGRWDLFAWRDDYFTRLRAYADAMNARGIVPVFTALELYSWSDRKARLLWVPDPERGPFRHNVNGIRWGGPDDPTFFSLPDAWMDAFLGRVVSTLSGTSYVIEIGNEMPEKEMHVRIARRLQAVGCACLLQVNRNEETPGQYRNMILNLPDFHYLAIHGLDDLGYLDEVWAPEQSTEPSYRAMWALADPARIVLSSDGARKSVNVDDAYDYPRLQAVATDALRRGAAYEHQTAVKLRRYTHGTYDLNDINYDAPFLRALVEVTR